MTTCSTCRFTAAERDPERGSGHTCTRIIHGNDVMGDKMPDLKKEIAWTEDGSGYAARFVVRPTFGCVLHEELLATALPQKETP